MRDSGDGWLHELKHDGYRIIAYKDRERVRLWSRNGRDWSAEFVAITEALRALPFRRIMLDGEAVTHCLEGLPDFHKLVSRDGQTTACLYAFDLIWLEAQDLRGVELIGRRRMLQKALKKADPALRFSEHMAGADGEAMFRHACAMGLEGIISKRVVSRYKSGACLAWVKVQAGCGPLPKRRSRPLRRRNRWAIQGKSRTLSMPRSAGAPEQCGSAGDDDLSIAGQFG